MILPESPRTAWCIEWGRVQLGINTETLSQNRHERERESDRDRETQIDRNRETDANRNIIKGHRESQKERHNLTLV